MLKKLILTLSIVTSTSIFLPESAKADDSYIYQDLQTSYSGNSKCISERNISASSYPIKSSSITTSAYCTLFFYQTSGYPKTVITNGLPTVIYGQWNKIWEGRIQATRQNNLDLNYIIKTPPATTLLSPTTYKYRFALCEDPNAQTSRQLTTPSSQSCRTYQVTSVGTTISRTPQQTTNPTPQQSSDPTPQQSSDPTPQQSSDPTPQDRSQNNFTPQPVPTFDIKPGYAFDQNGNYRLIVVTQADIDKQNKELDELRQKLIKLTAKTKKDQCLDRLVYTNSFGDQKVEQECWSYQPIELSSITGQITGRTLRFESPVGFPGTTTIKVTFTKYNSKVSKTIATKKYKIELVESKIFTFDTSIELPEYVGESGNFKGIIRLKISNDSIKGKKSITKRLN
jgi:hypothetical protein